jgi:hypothetical protein
MFKKIRMNASSDVNELLITCKEPKQVYKRTLKCLGLIVTEINVICTKLHRLLHIVLETAADTSGTKQLFETTELKSLKEILEKARSDHVTNLDIRQQCGAQPVGERILERREERGYQE